MNHVNLESLLCCPACRGELQLCCRVNTPSQGDKSGLFFCAHCDEVTGVRRAFRYDFLHFDRVAANNVLARHGRDTEPLSTLDGVVRREALPFDDPRIETSGSWQSWTDRYLLSHGLAGDELSYTGEFLDAGVRLMRHPWSGIAALWIDGRLVAEVDLYQPKWSEVSWFPVVHDLPPGRHTLRITPSGRRNPAARGAQILLEEIVVTRLDSSGSATPPARPAIDRALPLTPSAAALIETVPPDGWILDCGGGDRSLDDPRYVNLEYQEFEQPVVYGDAMQLPFRDNSFDLQISQAVLEHIQNPFRAVREMLRVAKPGTLVWAGVAFLQPLHAAPSHYFNTTVEGLAELFADFDIEDLSWNGPLSFTVDWLLKASNVAEKLELGEYQHLVERFRQLDPLVSYEDLRSIASGVAVRARKPLAGARGRRLVPAVQPAASPTVESEITALLGRGKPADLKAAVELIDRLPAPAALPDDATVRLMSDVAFAAEALGDYELCADLFSRALQYPVVEVNLHAGAHYRRGVNFERLGRWRDAIGAYGDALRLGHDWAHMLTAARWRLSRLLLAAEEYAKAETLIEQLTGELPHPEIDIQQVELNRGRCQFHLGRLDSATETLERACKIDPASRAALDTDTLLAEIYETLGQSAPALVCYGRMMQNPLASEAVRRAVATRLERGRG